MIIVPAVEEEEEEGREDKEIKRLKKDISSVVMVNDSIMDSNRRQQKQYGLPRLLALEQRSSHSAQFSSRLSYDEVYGCFSLDPTAVPEMVEPKLAMTISCGPRLIESGNPFWTSSRRETLRAEASVVTISLIVVSN